MKVVLAAGGRPRRRRDDPRLRHPGRPRAARATSCRWRRARSSRSGPTASRSRPRRHARRASSRSTVDWDVAPAQKGGYDFHAQGDRRAARRDPRHARRARRTAAASCWTSCDPRRRAARGRRRSSWSPAARRSTPGSSAKYAIEHWTRLPVEIEIASEFRYRDPVLGPDTLTLAVSQSGETIDTLEAARHARRQGSQVHRRDEHGRLVARARGRRRALHARGTGDRRRLDQDVRDADGRAVPPRALPGAGARRDVPRGDRRGARRELDELPAQVERAIGLDAQVRASSPSASSDARDFLFIGRHTGYPAALEGALKLKETQLHPRRGLPGGRAEARADRARSRRACRSSRSRPRCHVYPKMLSNIQEVKARGAAVIAVATEGDEQMPRDSPTTCSRCPRRPSCSRRWS